MQLQKKIDFALIFTVEKANPNGDPLNDNRPRQDSKGHGEVSGEAIRRKLRNAIQDMGLPILVQSNGRETDQHRSIKERLDGNLDMQKAIKEKKYEKANQIACETWFDARAFGHVMTYKGNSVGGITGPVSIGIATSEHPVIVRDMQITKSVNGEAGDGKGSDTMGMRSFIEFGLYKVTGSISPQMAERTGFTEEDAQVIKEALQNIFETDWSTARPAGSMEVRQLVWWEHDTKMGNKKKCLNALKIESKVDLPTRFEDYEIRLEEVEGVKAEVHAF